MSKVHGYLPTIYSAFCSGCEKVTIPETPSEMFCETCGSPLQIHVKVNIIDDSTNVVRPVRVRDMLSQSSRYSRFNNNEHSFQGEWRNILNVERHKSKAGKIAVAVERHTILVCDPEDVFLELFGGWYDNWKSPM